MAEYIDKQELIKSIVNTPLSWDYPVTPEHLTGSAKRQNEILALIDDMPAADVRENIRGSWMTDSDGLFICSECEEHAPQRMMFHPQPFYWTCDVQLTNFCPNCGAELIPEKLRGADMRGGDAE